MRLQVRIAQLKKKNRNGERKGEGGEEGSRGLQALWP